MKNLLIIIGVVIASLSVYCSQSNNEVVDFKNAEYKRLLERYDFNDTIRSIIEGKNFIFYIRGHNGLDWSMVVFNKYYDLLVTGIFTENVNGRICSIDTIFTNASILQWAIDSLKFYKNIVTPIHKKTYSPFEEELLVFSSEKEQLFESYNTDKYNIPNSTYFNRNFERLKYCMYWFALPESLKGMFPRPLLTAPKEKLENKEAKSVQSECYKCYIRY